MTAPRDPFDFSEYNSGRGGDDGFTFSTPAQRSPSFDDLSSGSLSGAAPFAEPGPSSAGTVEGELEARSAPAGWLLAAAVVAVAGAVLATTAGPVIVPAAVAWVMAGPLAIALIATFTTRDVQARATPVYVVTSWVRPAYWTALALVAVAVALSAWRIAEWVGRL